MVEQRASTPYVVGSTPITLAIFFTLFYIIIMFMKNNYYEELILKIEELIKDPNKNEEAINLIEEEFKLPFIPIYYEKKLKKIYEKIKPINIKSRNLFSKLEILEILKENNNSVDFLLSIAQMMEEYSWINSLEEIQFIFDSKIDNKVKAIIFSILVNQKIDYNFFVEGLELNPMKKKDLFETKYVLKNAMIIENNNDKDPLVKEVALKSFFIYVLNSFPNSLNFSFKDVSMDFFCIANVMLGNKLEEDLNEEQCNIFKIIKLN